MAKVLSIHRPAPTASMDGKKSLYLLFQLYKAINRHGWENGPTENEVRAAVIMHLGNEGLNPFDENRGADKDMDILTDRLMEQFDPVYGW